MILRDDWTNPMQEAHIHLPKICFLHKDSYLVKRVAFAGKHIWVTPYNETEIYPERKYINQNTKETGLGSWTKQNRGVENKDVVIWVTTGTTHIPRAEEWPMMPTEWVSIMLKPFNFFDRTPTLDL